MQGFVRLIHDRTWQEIKTSSERKVGDRGRVGAMRDVGQTSDDIGSRKLYPKLCDTSEHPLKIRGLALSVLLHQIHQENKRDSPCSTNEGR